MTDSQQGVVVVTGASRGLGLGIACLLAAQRIPLVLTARDKPSVQRVADALRTDTPVAAACADAADPQAMSRAFDAASELGPLVGLVNNAGVLGPIGPIDAIDPAAFEAHLKTNITGVMVGTQLALRHRIAGRLMRVVNISSGAAAHPYRSWAAYCSSKAAVNMLTQVAAIDCADPNVCFVAVAPGVIETDMQRHIRSLPSDQFPDVDQFRKLKDSNALLTPVDAAVVVDWLVRCCPADWSGRVVDAREPGVLEAVRGHAEHALSEAHRLFAALDAR